jgi:hypothetical protein
VLITFCFIHGTAALAYHNAQLEAVAFQEEFDPGAFEDLTEPKYDMMRKVHFLELCVKAGLLMNDA